MAGRLEGISSLVVADNPLTSQWIAGRLRTEGAKVLEVTSEDAALTPWYRARAAPSMRIDVAVIDLDARGGTGMEVALALSEAQGANWHWIAIGHRDDPLRRVAARGAGARAILLGVEAMATIAAALGDAATISSTAPGREMEQVLGKARHLFALDDDEVACARGILEERTNADLARRLARKAWQVARAMARLQDKVGVVTREGVAARLGELRSAGRSIS